MPETEAIENTRNKSGPKNIPIETLIDLRKKNLSYSQIAAILKIHPKSVASRLQPILQDLELTDSYKSNRADILRYKQRELLQAITPAKVEKANLQQLVWAYGVLYDKERLESGLSTQNLAYIDIIKAKQAVGGEMETIEAELVEAGIDPKSLSNSEKNNGDNGNNRTVPLQIAETIKK